MVLIGYAMFYTLKSKR